MKKIVLVVFLLVVGVAIVSAIDISASVRGGYGLRTGGQNMTGMFALMAAVPFSEETVINSSDDFTAASTLNIGNGMGIKLLAGVDVAFLNNFAVELLGGYVLGTEQDVVKQIDDFSNTSNTATFKTSFIPLSLTAKGKAFLGNFVFFAGAGPSVGLMAKSIAEITNDNGTNVFVEERELTYKVGIGYHGVFGIEYALTGNLSLLFEVRGEQLTFKPKKMEVTQYTIDGTDALGTLTTMERETEFSDDISDFLNSPIDPDAPDQRNAINIYGDSINAFLGVIWRF